MSENLAKAHRRVGQAEHAVEERMKRVAPETADPGRFEAAADELSEKADQHLKAADRVEKRSRRRA